MPQIETAVRPAYRPYIVRVARAERVGAHFVRVTFTGDDLAHFGTAGLDQRIKIVLPHADGTFSDFGQYDEAGDWYDRWRALPNAERNPFRTYTVRRVDTEAREISVDFVVHHDPGPAGAWAERATIGHEVVVVGPDARSPHSAGGIDWHPGNARRLLLAGDETAAPAICGIVESLDAACDVDAFIEVPTAADVLPVAANGARIHWLVREERAQGAALLDALRAWTAGERDLLARAAAPRAQVIADIDVDAELLWDSPGDAEGEFYAWIAGEAAAVKSARRMLVTENGVDRKRVAFMGYWRLGQSERIE